MYGYVDYNARDILEISNNEFLYLYAIQKMQRNKDKGFCIASNDYFSKLIGISIRGIQKTTKRLRDKGLLITGQGTNKKVSDKFLEATSTNKVHQAHEQSSPLNTNKVHPKHEQSSPNSYKDSNKDSYTNKEKNIQKENLSIGEQASREYLDYCESLNKSLNEKEQLSKKEKVSLKRKKDLEQFELFWNKYAHKINRKHSEKAFFNLSEIQKGLAISKIDNYFKHLAAEQERGFNKDKMYPTTWLNGRFNDEYKATKSNTVKLKVNKSNVPDWLEG